MWLGAALPDLAAMGRMRLDPQLVAAAPELLRVGVALHHRTDDAFHRHQWFTSRLFDGRHRLQTAGVGRGPARAVAHVGPELLLDGALGAAVVTTLEVVIDLLTGSWGGAAGSMVGGRADRWSAHVEAIMRHGLPGDNHDPDQVAVRLGRILHRRPLLRLVDTDHAPVLAHLRDLKPGIDATATGLVDELAAGIALDPL